MAELSNHYGITRSELENVLQSCWDWSLWTEEVSEEHALGIASGDHPDTELFRSQGNGKPESLRELKPLRHQRIMPDGGRPAGRIRHAKARTRIRSSTLIAEVG